MAAERLGLPAFSRLMSLMALMFGGDPQGQSNRAVWRLR
jgi:hypothetical protein